MNKHYERYKETFKRCREKNKNRYNDLSNKSHNMERFGKYLTSKEIVIELGGICCDCGITNEQHINKYGRCLSVHHRDGNGRNKQYPNNTSKNLVCLCLVCHAREHRFGVNGRAK